MKVLFVASLFHPHVGGIETIIRELSAEYRKRGIESLVLTKKWPDTLADEEIFEDVKIYRIKSPKEPNEFIETARWLKSNKKKLKADIIHVIGARRPLPFFALFLSKLWHVPLIVTIAGGEIPQPDDHTTEIIWQEGKDTIPQTILQADCVTAYSKALAETLKDALPQRKDVLILYGGIKKKEDRPVWPKKDKYIFSLRRLVWSKGIDVLVRAFDLVHKSYPQLKLIIAGDGEEKENLEKLTKELKLEDNIEFLGTISLEDADTYLANALISVVPSRSEGGGLSNLESQAMGCPVVATNVGGIPEYLGGDVASILVEPDDVPGLAKAMIEIIENEQKREKLIKNGFLNSKKFEWSVLCPKHLSLYNKLINSYRYRPIEVWSELSNEVRGVFDAEN